MGDVKGEMEEKERNLRGILRETGGILVAYSGGVDSSLLLTVAAQELGDRALGVLAVSPSRSLEESARARETAAALGLKILELETREFFSEPYSANTSERCYFCKRELFTRLVEIARREKLAVLAEGSQVDDAGEERPGRRAAREFNVRSPLAEAVFHKSDTRRLARALGLPNWNMPASPCLATRAAFGIPLTPELMVRIAEAEKLVRAALPGTRNLRVRHLGGEARIELDLERVREAEKSMDSLTRDLRALGYRRVTLSLEGYRSGSLAARAGDN